VYGLEIQGLGGISSVNVNRHVYGLETFFLGLDAGLPAEYVSRSETVLKKV
jgi:hypothetical protein